MNICAECSLDWTQLYLWLPVKTDLYNNRPVQQKLPLESRRDEVAIWLIVFLFKTGQTVSLYC